MAFHESLETIRREQTAHRDLIGVQLRRMQLRIIGCVALLLAIDELLRRLV